MSGGLGAALRGRCPACGRAGLYESFLMLHELCPACGVRHERYVSTRMVATVLAFGAGALAILGFDILFRGLALPASTLLPAGVVFAAVTYPVFRNVAVFLLWHNGLVTVDAPDEDGRRPPP